MSHQVVGYIRVSSQGQCIDRQLSGIELNKRFIDIISGSTKERPELKACMDYVREGDTLVVDSIDRLARNLRHLQDILTTLLEKGIIVRFVKESLQFTAHQDPLSTLMLQMMGAFAEFERNMIRCRQKEGIDLAIKNGKKMGRPSILNKVDKKQVKELKEQGISIRQIAKQMGISRGSVYKLLDLTKEIEAL